MTVIAALISGNMMGIAGERGASDNNNILRLATPKIWRSGSYLLGASGTMEGELLRRFWQPPSDIDKVQTSLQEFYDKYGVQKDSEMEVLICYQGHIYHHAPADLSLSEFSDPYVCIGSGYEYAYGSLFSSTGSVSSRLHKAVSAACEYSPTCLAPIDVLTVSIRQQLPNTQPRPRKNRRGQEKPSID